MGGQNRDIYEFAGFRLIPEESLLLRNGEPIALTPKAFSTLVLLVENHGCLVEKAELLNRVWENAFVEEAAVSRCIWSIRTALGADSKDQKFIQTVSKRGYRFVAEVTTKHGDGKPKQGEIFIHDIPSQRSGAQVLSITRSGSHSLSALAAAAEPEKDTVLPFPSDSESNDNGSRNRFHPVVVPRAKQRLSSYTIAAGIAIATIAAAVVIFYLARRSNGEVPILSQEITIERLSNDGGVRHAVITPDGKQIYYVRVMGDIQSIRLRDIETGNDIEVIEGSETKYYGLTVAPVGTALYFVRQPNGSEGTDLLRVSLPGGIPQNIADNVQGWTGISSDGSRISYVRCPRLSDDYCSLFVADSSNGENERKLVTRPAPFRIGDSTFSPDGEYVIFANGQSHTAGNEFQLDKVNVTTGDEESFSRERFFNMKNIVWLVDSNSLLITAARGRSDKSGFWEIDALTGQAAPLDKLNGNFNNVSLDQTSSLIVSTEETADIRLRIHDLSNKSAARPLSFGGDADFTPDGKIVFASNLSGQMDIWTVEPDGRGLRQLTDVPAEKRTVIADPGGTSIYYSSNRSGDLQVWKMNRDGTNPIQLTKRTGGYPITVTSDGRWVYFESRLDASLWRIGTEGANEEESIRKLTSRPIAVSPVGETLASAERIGSEFRISLSSVNDEKRLQSFETGLSIGRVENIKWSSDGSSIYYIQTGPVEGRAVIFKQILAGGPAIEMRDIDVGSDISDHGFAVSSDERWAVVSSGEWKHDLVLIKRVK